MGTTLDQKSSLQASLNLNKIQGSVVHIQHIISQEEAGELEIFSKTV